jgi:hypothetical protein
MNNFKNMHKEKMFVEFMLRNHAHMGCEEKVPALVCDMRTGQEDIWFITSNDIDELDEVPNHKKISISSWQVCGEDIVPGNVIPFRLMLKRFNDEDEAWGYHTDFQFDGAIGRFFDLFSVSCTLTEPEETRFDDDDAFYRIFLSGFLVSLQILNADEYSQVYKYFGEMKFGISFGNYREGVPYLEGTKLPYTHNFEWVNDELWRDDYGEKYKGELLDLDNKLPALIERLKRAGGDFELFDRLGRRQDRKGGDERIEWLVEGAIANGVVTLLAGAKETGKSTLITELAVAAASDSDATWLGCKVNTDDDGVVVLLSGEDFGPILNARLEALDPDDITARLIVYPQDGKSLDEVCVGIANLPKLSLLIVDPARRYLEGDEDGSDQVNKFFILLEQLASRTGAAVLCCHHLGKNAKPSSLQGAMEAIRGSSVWSDRPRVIMGMYRRRKTTMVGIAKHNIPPAYEMLKEIELMRDNETLRHIPVNAKVDEVTQDNDTIERDVLTAMKRLIGNGTIIRRAGNHELWQLSPHELNGTGRKKIRAAVDSLIDDNLISVEGDGLVLIG